MPALLACVAGPAFAADTYIEPQAKLRAESNSNINLAPGGSPESDVYGYIADVEAVIGIATPRSNTSMRPRVRMQEYPDREDFEKFELFFDLISAYEMERSRLDTIVRYSREDTYNAELQGGEFDPLDPNNPSNPDSGNLIIGERRNQFEIEPEYAVELSERMRFSVGGNYVITRYDSDEGPTTFVDYDFYEGKAFLTFVLDPRREFRVGGYANRFEAQDDSTDTDAIGAEAAFDYRWSENADFGVTLFYESYDTTELIPVPLEESDSNLGGSISARWKGEVSAWRISVGRAFIATGSGGKAESDQIRLQYNRDFTPRLRFLAAGRYESRTALSADDLENNRDLLRADLSLRWMMSRTWFLEGGYSYIWQDRELAIESGDNNKVFVGVGFKGLGR